MSKQARIRSTGAPLVTALNLEFDPMSSTTRRGFLQQTGALAASTVLFGCRAWEVWAPYGLLLADRHPEKGRSWRVQTVGRCGTHE